MKKFICLFVLISILTIQNIALALTSEQKLGRWATASYGEKMGVVKEYLENLKNRGILLVPYSNAANKKNAHQELIQCIDARTLPEYFGYSIGAGANKCCESMRYIEWGINR